MHSVRYKTEGNDLFARPEVPLVVVCRPLRDEVDVLRRETE